MLYGPYFSYLLLSVMIQAFKYISFTHFNGAVRFPTISISVYLSVWARQLPLVKSVYFAKLTTRFLHRLKIPLGYCQAMLPCRAKIAQHYIHPYRNNGSLTSIARRLSFLLLCMFVEPLGVLCYLFPSPLNAHREAVPGFGR